MGVRERTQSKRKPTQRKMKIPLVLLVACVASLKAASLMDSVFDESTCQTECCASSTTTTGAAEETTTGAPEARDETTTPGADGGDTTTAADGGDTTTAADGGDTTTTVCDCSLWDEAACNPDNGAGSASMSLLALLLPAVFARLL